MALIKSERKLGFGGWLKVWVALMNQVRRELRGRRFGGWLKVWEALIKLGRNWGLGAGSGSGWPLIKLEGNCGVAGLGAGSRSGRL